MGIRSYQLDDLLLFFERVDRSDRIYIRIVVVSDLKININSISEKSFAMKDKRKKESEN